MPAEVDRRAHPVDDEEGRAVGQIGWAGDQQRIVDAVEPQQAAAGAVGGLGRSCRGARLEGVVVVAAQIAPDAACIAADLGIVPKGQPRQASRQERWRPPPPGRSSDATVRSIPAEGPSLRRRPHLALAPSAELQRIGEIVNGPDRALRQILRRSPARYRAVRSAGSCRASGRASSRVGLRLWRPWAARPGFLMAERTEGEHAGAKVA